jgi:hypothetical protein
MRVTYFSAQGAIRMVYLNVDMYNVKDNGLIELTRIVKHAEPVPDVIGKAYMRSFDQYGTVAIINLAPGEYLEWTDDAERV